MCVSMGVCVCVSRELKGTVSDGHTFAEPNPATRIAAALLYIVEFEWVCPSIGSIHSGIRYRPCAHVCSQSEIQNQARSRKRGGSMFHSAHWSVC